MKYLKTFESFSINEEEEIIGKVKKFFTGYETKEEKEAAKKNFEDQLAKAKEDFQKDPKEWGVAYQNNFDGIAKKLSKEAESDSYRGDLEVRYYNTPKKAMKYVAAKRLTGMQQVATGSGRLTVGA
jgi:hypothetical protein